LKTWPEPASPEPGPLSDIPFALYIASGITECVSTAPRKRSKTRPKRKRSVVPSEEFVRQAAAILTSKRTKWHDANQVLPEIIIAGLAATRKQLGLTQAELGKRLGLPQSRISKIESNPDAITLRLLKRIAAALTRNH
jgi:DNA-binding XRE family transcriptional regulator